MLQKHSSANFIGGRSGPEFHNMRVPTFLGNESENFHHFTIVTPYGLKLMGSPTARRFVNAPADLAACRALFEKAVQAGTLKWAPVDERVGVFTIDGEEVAQDSDDGRDQQMNIDAPPPVVPAKPQRKERGSDRELGM